MLPAWLAVMPSISSVPRSTPPGVHALYAKLAPVYDLMYGLALEPGRRRGIEKLAPAQGDSILEIGVGTGLTVTQYPGGCRVTAIDLAPAMLRRAQARLERNGIDNVSLCRMNAAALAFADNEFDAVYAPYVMTVVDDPISVAREMLRVCRPGGKLIFVNHFRTKRPSLVSRTISPWFASALGVDWDLDLRTFLNEAGLEPVSIEPVNIPPVSSVLVCRKP